MDKSEVENKDIVDSPITFRYGESRKSDLLCWYNEWEIFPVVAVAACCFYFIISGLGGWMALLDAKKDPTSFFILLILLFSLSFYPVLLSFSGKWRHMNNYVLELELKNNILEAGIQVTGPPFLKKIVFNLEECQITIFQPNKKYFWFKRPIMSRLRISIIASKRIQILILADKLAWRTKDVQQLADTLRKVAEKYPVTITEVQK